jgi:hypothetical protein
MKFSTPSGIAAVCATFALAGCVVAPLPAQPAYGGPSYGGPGYAAQPAVVYVAPTYALPGPGYAWQHHAHFGWGWHHANHGWHRGWR